MTQEQGDPTEPPDEGDQDAEPTLNAPGENGPTGIDAHGETPEPDTDTEDQDSEPTGNAPGDAAP